MLVTSRKTTEPDVMKFCTQIVGEPELHINNFLSRHSHEIGN